MSVCSRRASPSPYGKQAAISPLGGGARTCRGALWIAADVRSGLQRSAPALARVLSRRAAQQAGTGQADRLADAPVRDADADGAGGSAPRRALRRGPRRAGLFARRDRQAREGGRDPGACMRAEEILFQIGDDGIAWLTFNRPEARNAMTFGMYQRLGEICRAPDPRMKVLILRGAGDKAFVSGTDIAPFRNFKTPKDALAYEATMDGVFDALEDVPVPTIAAIQGACTGGGAGIAAACDLRLGAPSARVGFPIARTLGNTLSMRNHPRLAAPVGVARTKDILFLARLMDAQEMRSPGLLNEITREEGLDTRAVATAPTLLEHAPLTLRAAKEALNRVVRHWAPPGGRDEFVVRNYMSEDFREGVESFLAKRKPRWTGK